MKKIATVQRVTAQLPSAYTQSTSNNASDTIS